MGSLLEGVAKQPLHKCLMFLEYEIDKANEEAKEYKKKMR
jgi:hypothetical protein